MASIKNGDIVEILFSSFQGDNLYKPLKVLNTPSNLGELWELEHKDGEILLCNPMSHSFVFIRKFPEQVELLEKFNSEKKPTDDLPF